MDHLSSVYFVDDVDIDIMTLNYEVYIIDIMVIENHWFDKCLGSVGMVSALFEGCWDLLMQTALFRNFGSLQMVKSSFKLI